MESALNTEIHGHGKVDRIERRRAVRSAVSASLLNDLMGDLIAEKKNLERNAKTEDDQSEASSTSLQFHAMVEGSNSHSSLKHSNSASSIPKSLSKSLSSIGAKINPTKVVRRALKGTRSSEDLQQKLHSQREPDIDVTSNTNRLLTRISSLSRLSRGNPSCDSSYSSLDVDGMSDISPVGGAEEPKIASQIELVESTAEADIVSDDESLGDFAGVAEEPPDEICEERPNPEKVDNVRSVVRRRRIGRGDSMDRRSHHSARSLGGSQTTWTSSRPRRRLSASSLYSEEGDAEPRRSSSQDRPRHSHRTTADGQDHSSSRGDKRERKSDACGRPRRTTSSKSPKRLDVLGARRDRVKATSPGPGARRSIPSRDGSIGTRSRMRSSRSPTSINSGSPGPGLRRIPSRDGSIGTRSRTRDAISPTINSGSPGPGLRRIPSQSGSAGRTRRRTVGSRSRSQRNLDANNKSMSSLINMLGTMEQPNDATNARWDNDHDSRSTRLGKPKSLSNIQTDAESEGEEDIMENFGNASWDFDALERHAVGSRRAPRSKGGRNRFLTVTPLDCAPVLSDRQKQIMESMMALEKDIFKIDINNKGCTAQDNPSRVAT